MKVLLWLLEWGWAFLAVAILATAAGSIAPEMGVLAALRGVAVFAILILAAHFHGRRRGIDSWDAEWGPRVKVVADANDAMWERLPETAKQELREEVFPRLNALLDEDRAPREKPWR